MSAGDDDDVAPGPPAEMVSDVELDALLGRARAAADGVELLGDVCCDGLKGLVGGC